MATCNYLPGILLLSFVGVYIGAGSNNIESQEPGTKSQDLRPVFGNVVHLSSADLNLEKAATQTSDFRPSTSVRLLRNRVKTIYDSQIGVRETGSNRGPEVEKYLRYAGLSKGNPWCAAFVCWVLGEAGVSNPRTGWSPDLFGEGRVIWEREPRAKSQEPRFLPSVPSAYASSLTTSNEQLTTRTVSSIKNQVSRFQPGKPSRSPSSLATGNWQRVTETEQGTKSKEQRLPTYIPGGFPSSLATGIWTRARNKEQRARSTVPKIYPISPTTNNQQPTTSDVFGIYFPEKARIAHVGFVDEWEGSWLITVEGNTNTSGSREGDGVYRKRRPVRSIYRVARYIN